MTDDTRLKHPPPAPPDGPPPVSGAPDAPPPEESSAQGRDWLSQRQGLRLARAALAVPVLLVLVAFAAMIRFALSG